MPLRGFILCVLTLLSSGLCAHAGPGDTIGSAVTIVNLVTAAYQRDQRQLASGDDVRQQELIAVSDEGRGELLLRDRTKLALGPGSRLLLDKFVYDPNVSGGTIALDLLRGAFRFVTGIAAKPAYIIRTPTASITVRGTIFDVYVQQSGTAWLLLIEGAVEVCAENGKCQVLDEPGKLIRIGSGEVGKPVKWASLPQKDEVPFDSAFPFIVTSPGFDPGPHFTRDQVVLGTFPTRPGGDGKATDEGDGKKDNADSGKGRKKKESSSRNEPQYVPRMW
jgi:hypothetical protein